MLDSCGTIEERMRRLLLDPDNEELLSEMEATLRDLDQRDRAVSNTLGALLKEVDDFILQMDQMEEEDYCEE
jgi:cytidylate kinase